MWLTVVSLICLLTVCVAEKAQPPEITSGFFRQIYFRDVKDEQTFDCTANGIPSVDYEWHFNDKKIVTEAGKVEVTGGKLQLLKPNTNNEGFYQCFASNKHGTSMSTVLDIRKVGLLSYRTLPIDDRGAFDEGSHVVLTCRNQPDSVPAATYTWFRGKEMLTTGKRIVIDQAGDLHFINVEVEDELPGDLTYNCSLYNDKAQLRVYGSPTKFKVTPGPDLVLLRNPTVRWFTENPVGHVGKSVTIQCIPDGYPLPTIVWSRRGGSLPTVTIDEEKYTLTITKVTENDEGTYVCTAVQAESNTKMEKVLFLDVKSEPIWEKKLKSVTVTNGKTAKFECVARSARGETDNVLVKWFRNGKPLSGGTDGKITVSGRELTVTDVVKPDDLMNIQCNVSNSIGYQLADASLNVIEQTNLTVRPPQKIIIHPGNLTRARIAAEADPLYASQLTYRWSKDGQPVGKNRLEPVYVDAANTLIINATGYDDSPDSEFPKLLGTYSCLVSIGLDGGDIVVSSEVATSKDEEEPPQEASLWWVAIIVLVVLLIIIIIIILICLRYRNRGETYPVDEKERSAGHDPEKELADSGFEDLTRTDAQEEKNPYFDQVPLTEDPSHGGDTDRPGPYTDPQYNEDGAFLSDYGGQKGRNTNQSKV